MGNGVTSALVWQVRVSLVLAGIIILGEFVYAQREPHERLMVEGAKRGEVAASQQFRNYQQGFNIRTWLSNTAAIGEMAFLRYSDNSPSDLFGLEYPEGSGIEHLYGAGVWIGALIDTASSGSPRLVRAVSTGEYGAYLEQEFWGHPDGRDSFFVASIDDRNGHNRRNYDDDHDGRIDEDELDGYDNDGDWNAMADDLGTDGLPDSLEIGCGGPYDPLTNPDPAHDNWDSTLVDRCAESSPVQRDRFLYTQGNGYPNHGEPNVDEDYAATSENDAYVSYADIYGHPSPEPGHIPLGIRVWQRSYTWRSRIKVPLLPFEYLVTNVGGRTLDSVYVGFFCNPHVGPRSVQDFYTHNATGYFPDERTAYADNHVDKPSTPIGVTFLHIPGSLDSLRYTFRWYPIEQSPRDDQQRYALMSSGTIMPNEFPQISNTRFMFSVGPIQTPRGTKVAPGDTIRIAVALVCGDDLETHPNNLRDNARFAYELYLRNWQAPVTPPSPPLKMTMGDDQVLLDWSWTESSGGCNPVETWDDSSRFVGALPDTHWRRRTPELRCPSSDAVTPPGGRIFEGYRLWRSESPIFDRRTFTLLAEYDVIDDLNFGYGTGLRYTHVDSNLIRGRKYWYAVTSFSIPRISLIDISDSSGPRVDTLWSPPLESDVSENLRLVMLPFSPATRPGQVKVVPNPYRTDMDYTFESGGWEGLARNWTENRRVIWFIHLPSRCTIRVFSLGGDLITTIEHDDESRSLYPDRPVGQEEWNLLSASGRAIASGLYVFVVESEFGKQIGKFVIIR